MDNGGRGMAQFGRGLQQLRQWTRGLPAAERRRCYARLVMLMAVFAAAGFGVGWLLAAVLGAPTTGGWGPWTGWLSGAIPGGFIGAFAAMIFWMRQQSLRSQVAAVKDSAPPPVAHVLTAAFGLIAVGVGLTLRFEDAAEQAAMPFALGLLGVLAGAMVALTLQKPKAGLTFIGLFVVAPLVLGLVMLPLLEEEPSAPAAAPEPGLFDPPAENSFASGVANAFHPGRAAPKLLSASAATRNEALGVLLLNRRVRERFVREADGVTFQRALESDAPLTGAFTLSFERDDLPREARIEAAADEGESEVANEGKSEDEGRWTLRVWPRTGEPLESQITIRRSGKELIIKTDGGTMSTFFR